LFKLFGSGEGQYKIIGKCAEALNKFLRPKRGGKLFRLLRQVEALTDSCRQTQYRQTDTPVVLYNLQLYYWKHSWYVRRTGKNTHWN